jgi:hypothetical protein
MEKIVNFVRLLARICGGWFNVMSGGLSIPLVFVGLYFGGSAKTSFWALAFLGLAVCAIGAARKNYDLMKESPVMKIEAIRKELTPAGEDPCIIRVTNTHPNKSFGDVKVKLLSMQSDYIDDLPIEKAPDLPIDLLLVNPENANGMIHPGGEVDFVIFQTTSYGFPSNMEKAFVITSFLGTENSPVGKPKQAHFMSGQDYVLAIKVMAENCPPTIAEFALNFKMEGPVWVFTMTQK